MTKNEMLDALLALPAEEADELLRQIGIDLSEARKKKKLDENIEKAEKMLQRAWDFVEETDLTRVVNDIANADDKLSYIAEALDNLLSNISNNVTPCLAKDFLACATYNIVVALCAIVHLRSGYYIAPLLDIFHITLQKNRSYGASSFYPVERFSKASPIERVLSRMDDKWARIQVNPTAWNEDAWLDLAGYLFILLALILEKGEDNA